MPTARSSRRCSRPSLATPRRPEKQGICSVPPQIKSSRSPNKGNAISTKTAQKTVWLRPKRVQTRRMQPTQRTRRIFDGGDAEHRMLVRVALRSPSALANRDHPTRRMLPTPDRIWSVHGQCEIGWSAPGSLPASVNVLYVLRGARPLADGGNTGSRPNPSLWLPHPLGLRRVWLVLTRSPVPEGSTRSGS